MADFLKNRFRHKEDKAVLITLLFFLVGLVIQIIVVVCSFFWSDEQFGLPRTSSDLFIVATILNIFPFIGYIAFLNFFLIFLTTFQGSSLLAHPWFYHLLGMAMFNVGMIIFMIKAS